MKAWFQVNFLILTNILTLLLITTNELIASQARNQGGGEQRGGGKPHKTLFCSSKIFCWNKIEINVNVYIFNGSYIITKLMAKLAYF